MCVHRTMNLVNYARARFGAHDAQTLIIWQFIYTSTWRLNESFNKLERKRIRINTIYCPTKADLKLLGHQCVYTRWPRADLQITNTQLQHAPTTYVCAHRICIQNTFLSLLASHRVAGVYFLGGVENGQMPRKMRWQITATARAFGVLSER